MKTIFPETEVYGVTIKRWEIQVVIQANANVCSYLKLCHRTIPVQSISALVLATIEAFHLVIQLTSKVERQTCITWLRNKRKQGSTDLVPDAVITFTSTAVI